MTDWCVWKNGPYGRNYRHEETATYEQHYAAELLIRKDLTNRQAFVLAQCLEDGVPIYCEDLLPEEGQRVRFWVAPGVAMSGLFRGYFVATPGLWTYSPGEGKHWAYAWEPEPPAPPLPGGGK